MVRGAANTTNGQQIGSSAVRKSRRLSTKLAFLFQTDREQSALQHADIEVVADDDNVLTVFEKLFNLVEQWQEDVMDGLAETRETFMSNLYKYVTNGSVNGLIIWLNCFFF